MASPAVRALTPCALPCGPSRTPPFASHVDPPPPPRQPFAWVLLVGDTTRADQVFVKVFIAGCADVSDVSKRACEDFGLGAGAPSRCSLYLVPDEAHARAIARDPSSAVAILQGVSLFATDEVVTGSWLLARVPPPPAAAPGASRR